MLHDLRISAKIFLAIFVFFILHFSYFAITTTPQEINESDSLFYHIPLAQSISQGNLLSPPELEQGLGYYPAVGEAILSLFVLTEIPLNLYNVLGLVILFIASYYTGKSFGLKKNLSLIFATSISLIHSLVRLTLNQTVDVWLASFFLLCLYYVNQLGNHDKGYLKLGVFLGLLTGVKYSGILIAFSIVLVFYHRIVKNLNLKRLVYLMVPIIILGLFWYVRNYFLKGNPLWPSTFLFWKGDPTFPKFDFYSWNLLGNIIKNPKFTLDLLNALNSEFLLWPFVIFLSFTAGWLKMTNKLVILGLTNFIFFLLFLPYWPGVEISNLRLIISVFAPLILAIYLQAQNIKFTEIVLAISLFNILFVATQLNFHPKLFSILAVIILYFFYLNKKISSKIFNS